MLLVVDAGNTNVVFAVYDGGEKVFGPWRIRSDSKRSRDEYASWIIPLLEREGLKVSDISGAVVSSVTPDSNHHLRGFCRHYMDVEPQFVTYDLVRGLGLEVEVDNPESVGADRLVNSVAVKQDYRFPAIVIDFGTATTFDVMDRHGVYVGGVIAPGINLSLSALHQAAAMLPKVSVRRTEKVICKNTVQAMQSGVFWGYAGLVEGMVSRLSTEMGEKNPLVIATGGLAPVFEESIKVIEKVDRNLTIRGLYHIYRLGNKKS